MNDSGMQPETEHDPLDPRQPGKARTVYTIIAVTVVISLVLSLAGYALWDKIF